MPGLPSLLLSAVSIDLMVNLESARQACCVGPHISFSGYNSSVTSDALDQHVGQDKHVDCFDSKCGMCSGRMMIFSYSRYVIWHWS